MILIYPILFSLIFYQTYHDKSMLSDTQSTKYEWIIAELLVDESNEVEIQGSPKLTTHPMERPSLLTVFQMQFF